MEALRKGNRSLKSGAQTQLIRQYHLQLADVLQRFCFVQLVPSSFQTELTGCHRQLETQGQQKTFEQIFQLADHSYHAGPKRIQMAFVVCPSLSVSHKKECLFSVVYNQQSACEAAERAKKAWALQSAVEYAERAIKIAPTAIGACADPSESLCNTQRLHRIALLKAQVEW